MAKNSSKNNAKKIAGHNHHEHDGKDRTLHNPLQTWWGKAVVWMMLIGMLGGIVFAFIFALISGTA